MTNKVATLTYDAVNVAVVDNISVRVMQGTTVIGTPVTVSPGTVSVSFDIPVGTGYVVEAQQYADTASTVTVGSVISSAPFDVVVPGVPVLVSIAVA